MIREEYRRAKRELKLGDRVYLQTKGGLEKFNGVIFQLYNDEIYFTDGTKYHYKDVYCMTQTSNQKPTEPKP
jgi:hypothetical protein